MEQLREFERTYGGLIATTPGFPNQKLRDLRISLIREEFDELLEAEANDDLVEVADALADMVYVIAGHATNYGIPLDTIFNEVHASNMSKLGEDGKPIYRSDGKILKGPNFWRPNIAKILKDID